MSGYRLGAELERAAAIVLAGEGYFTVRSAGSHGPADVIAIKPGELLLVQCKLDGYLTPAERSELRELAAWLGAVPLAAGWHKHGRAARTIRFTELVLFTVWDPAGSPRDWSPVLGLGEPKEASNGFLRRADGFRAGQDAAP